MGENPSIFWDVSLFLTLPAEKPGNGIGAVSLATTRRINESANVESRIICRIGTRIASAGSAMLRPTRELSKTSHRGYWNPRPAYFLIR
jgi:hypothetical protein